MHQLAQLGSVVLSAEHTERHEPLLSTPDFIEIRSRRTIPVLGTIRSQLRYRPYLYLRSIGHLEYLLPVTLYSQRNFDVPPVSKR
jgi:hypothetical protein